MEPTQEKMSANATRSTRDSIADVWGPRTPYHLTWPTRVDELIADQPERWAPSACVLCSLGCGLDIGVKAGRIVGVRGRESDRVNHGRLGPKGMHGWVANHSADRLTVPMIRCHGDLQSATWEEAMDLIVRRSKACINQHTANSIGFYTSGQLFLEEYYTLGIIGKAGLGTPHMDGSTRLCTATAAAALKASFGTDGQPGSYDDLDIADTLMFAGHNMASQQTVMWMRVLDRRAGSNPPRLLAIDPRRTETAKEADVHLAPRVGTNLALFNGLEHLLITRGWIDRAFIQAHTVGYEKLARLVAAWTPGRVERVTGIPERDLLRAAEIIGETPRLMSTVLQGIYQSMQATAAAVQINNIHLLRGMIGKAGCTVLQMNGQPTAENTRECGADGDMPGFRNWQNESQMQDLARIWNVERATLPTYAPPTHAMQMFRYAEEGTIKMLWISGTNPAVSLPELHRIRRIFNKDSLFVIVQDAFLTETTEYADVVLPVALWGEKTGCYTNADRTVHLSEQAVEPPGQAKSDLEIFIDYAQRMDFQDKDGALLVKWRTAEECFEAWKMCSRDRPCDYSGLSYQKLRTGSGIQWPCTEQAPEGTPRLYTDHRFNTQAGYCETFGHDLATGAVRTQQEYLASDPQGRAILHAEDYHPPQEVPDGEYPFWVTTGRLVYHWHTRTKTGRSRELNEAAPDAFVQMHEEDAARLGIHAGDLVEVESRRGSVTVPAKLGDILQGHLFIPFHFGSWDHQAQKRAANELTVTEWDPVSKQPYFKHAAVRAKKVSRLPDAGTMPLVTQAVTDGVKSVGSVLRDVSGHIRRTMSSPNQRPIGLYLERIEEGERCLTKAFHEVAHQYIEEPDIHATSLLMASWSREQADGLKQFIVTYDTNQRADLQSSMKSLFEGSRSGGGGLLRDLRELWLAANEVYLEYEIVRQGAMALHDQALVAACEQSRLNTNRQLAWLRTRIDQLAPQTLVMF